MMALLLFAWSAAASAQIALPSAQAPDDVTDWTAEAPPKPGAATSAEGSFSSAETIRFGEQMRHNVLEDICRGIDLNAMQGLSRPNVGGISGGIDDSIKILPDEPGKPVQRLALVEQTVAALDLGRTLVNVVRGADVFGIRISLDIRGTSTVVRPLPSNKSCKEIGKLLKFWHQKTALPLTAERIAAMDVGELWKLPAGLSIGYAPTAAAPNPYGGPSVSFGTGQTGASMLTLYRLAPDKLRVRLRIDHARVHNNGGQVVAILPAVRVITAGGWVLLKALENAVDRAIAGALSDFISGMFGLNWQSAEGQQLLMEFVFDPNDSGEMEKLARVLNGDIKTFVAMVEKTVTLQATPERAAADLRALEAQHERDLGRVASYPALDVYHGSSKNITFSLPFIVKHAASKVQADDQILQLSAEGGQIKIYRAEKTNETGYVNVPIKGVLFKRNELRSAQSFVIESKDGAVSAPQAVYIQHEGFLRQEASAYRRRVEEVNTIMSLVGARGGSRNHRLEAPVDGLIPPLPPPLRDAFSDEEIPVSKRYDNGSIRWTLVFTQKAVADIVSAADELIVRCFVNTLDAADQGIMGWVMSQPAWLGADGSINYDWRAARKKFVGDRIGDDGDNDDADYRRLQELSRQAAAILLDVANVRRAPTQETKADAMTTLLAGRGESGMEYQDILKVLVQLVDPLNLTSDLNINISKGVKGEADAHSHLVLKKGRPENPQLKAAGDAKTRFAKPSDLVD